MHRADVHTETTSLKVVLMELESFMLLVEVSRLTCHLQEISLKTRLRLISVVVSEMCHIWLDISGQAFSLKVELQTC